MALLKSVAIVVSLMTIQHPAPAQNTSRNDSLRKALGAHPQPDTVRIDLLNHLAFENYLIHPDTSLRFAYEAMSLSKEIHYLDGEAQSLRQIGIISWAQANYATALKNFMAALKLAETTRHTQLIADITGNLGLVYFGLADYSQAERYQQASFEMQHDLGNKTRQAVALNNLGDIHRALKNYEVSIQFYTKALKLRHETNSLPGVATNIRNIGNVYEAQGDLGKALEQYNKSLKISDSLGEKRGMSQCRHSIASIYFRQKQYAHAKQFALESIAISKQARFKSFVRDSYLLLSQICEAQNEFRQSFDFFRQYSNYRDSVINLKVTSEIALHRLDYETNKKQAEIDLLKKDAALKTSEITQKNTLLFSGSLILVLVVILAIILYKNFSIQKYTNMLLAVKNREIEHQHREISSQRDELVALNEEIRAQQEDLMSSRDTLAQRNAAIAAMNERILVINGSLEQTVKERTEALEKQNQQLLSYAFINAHKLRGPLARILGLTNLLSINPQSEEQKEMLQLLQNSVTELDDVTRSITEVVDKGLNAFHHQNEIHERNQKHL